MDCKPRAMIFGVTGAIGRGLPAMLAVGGIATTGVSRREGPALAEVERWQQPDAFDLAGHDIIINLAGESIASRWTAARRRRFHHSRVGLTGRIVEAIAGMPAEQRPKVLVNGSAVGIYGDRGDEELTESSGRGSGYLADLCDDWEVAAGSAESLGVRVVRLRTGVVLGRDAEAFLKMKRVFKLGLGGRLGSGRQWMPWIHIDDLRGAIVHAVRSESLRGPVNGAAPVAERNADFTRKLAAAMRRPAVLPVPGFALKLVLGGFGGALLASQKAVPAALEADGFTFRYPTLDQALGQLLG